MEQGIATEEVGMPTLIINTAMDVFTTADRFSYAHLMALLPGDGGLFVECQMCQ